MSVPEISPESAQVRAAKSESLFREVNERVRELGTTASDQFEFACECAQDDCAVPLSLTPIEYEDVRRFPTRFIVRPGHEIPAVERLVETNERFTVVEKFGAAGIVAVRLDPRSRRTSTHGSQEGLIQRLREDG